MTLLLISKGMSEKSPKNHVILGVKKKVSEKPCYTWHKLHCISSQTIIQIP